MLKKVSTLSIAILAAANVFAANVWDGSVAEAFTAGKGTVAEPYQISNGAELALFAQKVTGGDTTLSAVLTDDIYLNENTEQYATWGKKSPPMYGQVPSVPIPTDFRVHLTAGAIRFMVPTRFKN